MSTMQILARVLEAYTYVIFASVIVSWLPIDRSNPFIQLLDTLTDPILNPIRKLIPPEKTGNLDFSPIVALVGLQMLASTVATL